MNNRVQQRFDRSIREAVKQSAAARERDRAAKRRPARELVDEPRRAARRMQLMRDAETGGTVLVPWGNPDAVAWRAARARGGR
jgi:hypothetical protein